MTDQKKAAPAAKPVAKPTAATKPPKKLIPRTAPKAAAKPEVLTETPPVAAPKLAEPAAASPVAPPVVPKARTVRKPSRVDETVARHQAVLADALVKAQAIKYDQPKVMKQEAAKPKKAEKPVKAKKAKLIRDSYAMPEAEYARIGEVKKRLVGMKAEAKKSEILRAGIAVLAALNDAELKAVMTRVERIKTGRPSKK
ncbi:MAG: hypothetical protein Q8S26_02095 [Azonexus sp.]|nr:hypothetical protein [Azonexus sp.]